MRKILCSWKVVKKYFKLKILEKKFSSKLGAKCPKNFPTCYCKIQSDPAEGNLRLTDLKKRQKSVKKKYKNTVSVARTNLTWQFNLTIFKCANVHPSAEKCSFLWNETNRGGAAKFGFISITYHKYILGVHKYILRLEISTFDRENR